MFYNRLILEERAIVLFTKYLFNLILLIQLRNISILFKIIILFLDYNKSYNLQILIC